MSSVFYSACVGSITTTLVCTPFDVVKNYWQGSPYLNHKRNTVSAIDVVQQIKRQFGLRGFWRGTPVSLAYVLPNNITYFTIYENEKKKGWHPAVAAAQARTVAVLCFSPIEFLRTKVQACIGQPGSGSAYEVMKKVLTEDKFSSLWRGAIATLMRDVPFSVTYFTIYEFNKRTFINKPFGNKTSQSHTTPHSDDVPNSNSSGFVQSAHAPKNHLRTFGWSLVNGATCGAIATLATHPFDVVKTQLQSYERVKSVNQVRVTTVYSTMRAWTALYGEYGLRGLFTIGLTPRLLKVIPASAIMLSTYELIHSLLDS